MSQDAPTGGFRKTSSGRRLTGIITNDYLQLHQKASEGAFVVWIAIVVPAELLAGFDNVVYAVPESHAAMCAGKGVAVATWSACFRSRRSPTATPGSTP